MEVSYQDLGLKEGYLYEILATTISLQKEKIIPNTSCMGIRINDKKIIIKPYPNTKTYENLKENSIICINFVENIYLYALAALKGSNLSKKFRVFPENYYNYYNLSSKKSLLKKLEVNQIPYIRQSWAIIICKANKFLNISKEDIFGKVDLSEFILDLFSIIKFRESYKLFNRAENLILETLILTTRLKVALEKKSSLMIDFQNKINKNINYIQTFSKNKDTIKSIKLIEEYIKNLNL